MSASEHPIRTLYWPSVLETRLCQHGLLGLCSADTGLCRQLYMLQGVFIINQRHSILKS